MDEYHAVAFRSISTAPQIFSRCVAALAPELLFFTIVVAAVIILGLHTGIVSVVRSVAFICIKPFM